jgi:MFS family permease
MTDLSVSKAGSPGATQGWVLIATTWLAVAAAAIIAPVAPRMASHFGGDPQTVALVQIGIGMPSLFVALLAGLFGALADRIGRRILMLGALLLYAACGTAPLWLDALPLILASRAGVGIAEAAVLATGTALISDYFVGDRRDRWFAIQGGTATLVAFLLITTSGALSETGWHLPFAIYALPVLLAILVARWVWEPAHASAAIPQTAARLWPQMLPVCLVSLVTAVAFFIVLIQLPFLLQERGFGAPGQVTLGEAAATITAPIGAMLFRLMARRSVTTRLAASYAFSCLGLAMIVLSPAYGTTVAGAAINGIGSGIALPTLMGWAMAGRAPSVAGRAAGVWNSVYSLGQFASPPLFLAVVGVTGGFASAMAVFAVLLGIAAVAAAVAALMMQPALRSPLNARQSP